MRFRKKPDTQATEPTSSAVEAETEEQESYHAPEKTASQSSGDAGDAISVKKTAADNTSSTLDAVDTSGDPERNLSAFSQLHTWDPNLPEEKRNAIQAAVDAHDVDAEKQLERELNEASPYPEVNAAVPATDEDVPANTLRAWVLGMVFVTIGSGLNMLFSLRQPSIQITSIVAQLVSFPFGLAMAQYLPKKQFSFFGMKFSLNPGPFNKKEHALITIMANVSFAQGAAYSTYTVEAMRGFYKMNWGFGFNILFTLVTQCLGLGLAGIFRKWLVYPAQMFWPGILPNAALFYTLHKEGHTNLDPDKTNGWRISRYRWFGYVCLASFIWYWVPGVLFQALSVFAWVTWIKPNNVLVNQICGGFTGLSIIPPAIWSFDWTYITAYILSPLIPPWHAIMNTMIGVVIFTWFVVLGIHYTDTWWAQFLPISDSDSYDNTANSYNVSRILTPEYTLDIEKYREYSPLFLSTTFALQYGLSFATIIAVIVHTGLFHGKEIWMRFKSSRHEEDDVHMKMMRKYPEVPQWWFLAMLVIFAALGFVTVLHWDTKLPWWGMVLAIAVAGFFFVPIGSIQAMTNIQIGLNVFTEYIITYMLPGRPIAMMAFKTLGYITMYQGVIYAQDLKLGHYLKVPPRTLFWGQLVASVWSCFVQIGVLSWAFSNIDGICTKEQSSRFTCPNGRVFFNASVIWGVIGPQRIFSGTGIYSSLQWFWLLGALLPIAFYFLARKFPKSSIRYLSAPIILGGTAYIPPATPFQYLMWGAIGFIFNKYLRNRVRGWWSTYNYITSAALDAGLALSTIVIFFTIIMTNTKINWWGNNVVESTLDAQDLAIRVKLGEGETFGPEKGNW